MALNIDKIGRPLARIDGGKYKGKIISVSDKTDDEITKDFTQIKLTDGKFQWIPDTTTERTCAYITGASGSGKSYFIKEYCKEYKKVYKKREIYMFSALTEDETMDTEIKLKRVKIDDSLISDPIDVSLFEESLVIFDDIDVIGNKKHREAVYTVLNQVLEIGRHFKISCCVVNHLATGGKDTRRILNECSVVVYFPHSGSLRQLRYLLEQYVGLDKLDMVRAKKSKSRWACILKNYPQVLMTEKEIWLLSGDE